MIERETPRCPYCEEELQYTRVVMDNDVGSVRADFSGTLYCVNKKCPSKKICRRKFKLDSDGLVKEYNED